MFYLKAQATKLLDNSTYPEIILCELTDAHGTTHRFAEKWPIVSGEKFDNTFPKACTLGCVIVEKTPAGYLVSTEQPWCIESLEGQTMFEITEDLLFEETE